MRQLQIADQAKAPRGRDTGHRCVKEQSCGQALFVLGSQITRMESPVPKSIKQLNERF